MDEREVIDALVAELEFAKDTYWQQPGYKDSLFQTFSKSPKNEQGIPALCGDTIRERARDKLGRDSEEFKAIEKILYEVCDAWDEWRYAIENWSQS